MAVNPFDFIGQINKKQDNVNADPDPYKAIKGYSAYLTNRALSYHYDTLTASLRMNLASVLPDKQQYDYLINTVRPRARFGKFSKPSEDDDVKAISKYYNVNMNTAIQYRRLLNEQDILDIRRLIGDVDDGDRV